MYNDIILCDTWCKVSFILERKCDSFLDIDLFSNNEKMCNLKIKVNDNETQDEDTSKFNVQQVNNEIKNVDKNILAEVLNLVKQIIGNVKNWIFILENVDLKSDKTVIIYSDFINQSQSTRFSKI